MNEQDLGAIEVARMTGTESFHFDGDNLSFDVLEFWRWSMSDLVCNTSRGVLAEFIVAKALGVSVDCAREEWNAYDLETGDGIRIEVKSSAFVQSWAQDRLSAIQFVVPKKRGWDSKTNTMEDSATRHADVYVFALLAHKDKASIDPTDLSQWQFFVLPTKVLDERQRSQHSITLNSLQALAGPPVDYWRLHESVNQAYAEDKGPNGDRYNEKDG